MINYGPTWQLHALLRACALTNQNDIIRQFGLDPGTYRDNVISSKPEETQTTPLQGRTDPLGHQWQDRSPFNEPQPPTKKFKFVQDHHTDFEQQGSTRQTPYPASSLPLNPQDIPQLPPQSLTQNLSHNVSILQGTPYPAQTPFIPIYKASAQQHVKSYEASNTIHTSSHIQDLQRYPWQQGGQNFSSLFMDQTAPHQQVYATGLGQQSQHSSNLSNLTPLQPSQQPSTYVPSLQDHRRMPRTTAECTQGIQ